MYANGFQTKEKENLPEIDNICAPNDYREQEQFIRILGEKLVSKTGTTKLITSGDWNATLNKIDKWGGLPWKETSYRNSIIDLMEELDSLAIYRQFRAGNKSFTYETKNSKLKSRIHFFLISRPISYNVKKNRGALFHSTRPQSNFFRFGVTK